MPEPTPKARAEAAQHLLDALDFDDDLALSDAQRVGIIAAALLTAEARGRQAGLDDRAELADCLRMLYRQVTPEQCDDREAMRIKSILAKVSQPTPPEGG